MVSGGETGSNAAAVLIHRSAPLHRDPALYMDWLSRTNPNNLYPFVCVLPSGGIFVAYWNEARILDQTTFDTIKVLPNIKARSTMTLPAEPIPGRYRRPLPQHAPYTAPFEVLICGGSTDRRRERSGQLCLDPAGGGESHLDARAHAILPRRHAVHRPPCRTEPT